MLRAPLDIALLCLIALLLGLTSCRPKEVEVPKAERGRFAVVVADFEADDDRRHMKELVSQELKDLTAVVPSLQVLDVRQQVEVPDLADLGLEVRTGHQNARALLRETGASVVLWGQVQGVAKEDRKAVLYLTTGSRWSREGVAEHYVPRPELNMRLPVEFWGHLGDVLALVVVVESAEFEDRGSYLVERMRPFIEKVEGLRGSERFRQMWSEESRGAVDSILGYCWGIVGEQAGDKEALRNAVSAYRAALEGFNRDRFPLDWATTQTNLGGMLLKLAEWEEGDERQAHLEESMAVFEDALKIFTSNRLPLEWATIQVNLGNALLLLAEQEDGPSRLGQAVATYQAALDVFTKVEHPILWAMSQHNLGVALRDLGAREAGVDRMEEAAEAFRAALTVFTRDRHPLDWAATQNALGTVLATLGRREGSAERLKQAVAAHRDVLEVFTRERLPVQWATTQSNLGVALQSLGEQGPGVARIKEAITAYRAALEVFTRDQLPLQWATTQNNLGVALVCLGKREHRVDLLEEAVAVYRSALEIRTRDRLPFDWAMTQDNLGNALVLLGMGEEGEKGVELLEEAVAGYRAAIEVRTRNRLPFDWAMTQCYLGIALEGLASRTMSTERRCEAVDAFLHAWSVLHQDPLYGFILEALLGVQEEELKPIEQNCPRVPLNLLVDFRATRAE